MDNDHELPPSVLQHDDRIRFNRERVAMADDRYRPAYHFVPPGGILHDPNGALYWQGRYHLFYQFWPPTLTQSRDWDAAMHWGHAVSDDLVHWQDLPIALSADAGPESSCYSGQALVEDDRVVLMYHGPHAGNCIATGSDEFLVDIEKHPDNPVIPIDEAAPYRVFDPCIWRGDDGYYSLSGSYVDGVRGTNSRDATFLFRSEELGEWEYLGPLTIGGFHTDPGEDAAVPNFVPLGDKHLLLFFSHTRGPQYYLGTYDAETQTFEIERHARLEFGSIAHSNLHAPSVCIDDADRRIAFFNVTEGTADRQDLPPDSWRETLALPRHLFDDDGGLGIRPVPELAKLRREHRHYPAQDFSGPDPLVIDESAGASIEVQASVAIGNAQEVGMHVLRSPDGEEQTTISYWPADDVVGLDTSRSSVRSDVLGRAPALAPLTLADDACLELQVFVDRSIVEVFVNDRQALTTRVYPKRADSVGLVLYARRGGAQLHSVDVWTMASIWE